ncbi:MULTISPECIES: heat-inducible transcriptional repressor HrcA [Brevibacterium]|uniref:Heat-inducible transcription repressor HrcA n=1 Tax=Brevibacterium salitolerans TaxID=1403566 RepID=A0ABP5I210_9MICO|nr:heat-inducible transcriptional repressor HrcA [Brevibacterium sp.]
MNDDRRARVLQAIVEDYVSTNEPVGSKALVEKHRLGVSSATIRNDMAALEQDGLIAQPHTSAGRIPTDKGYRHFVDRIDEIKPLSAAEKRAVARVLSHPVDVDDILDRTVRLLSQLTHQVALVQYPRVTTADVRHIELVDLAPTRVLVVLITSGGQVEQRLADVGREVSAAEIADVRDLLLAALAGTPVAQVPEAVEGLRPRPEEADLATAVGTVLADLSRTFRTERLVMAGTANLARAGTELGASIGPLLEAFEEQVVLLRLLSGMTAEGPDVAVSIGSENAYDGFATTSLVATNYLADGIESRMAVLGPTRMDYPTTMAALRSVARYVSAILND